jgi:NADPH:quinone reductase-like Zn-dependent oxidoreductase
MTHAIPSEMRVLELSGYDEDLSTAVRNLHVTTKATPRPGRGQVLVRIEAAPCNPSDITFLQGLYGVQKALPAVPGWEGAGTVVASGGGLFARWLEGRRVACGGQTDSDGTWAEYYLASAKSCMPLRKGLSFAQGASLLVNPLTAWALIDRARRGRHGGIVQTAAASQLGRIVVRLARDAGLPVINIVRRGEQADILASLGADIVLNSATEGFQEKLREACHRYKATIAFDPVAGELTGKILNAMPQGATVIVYGALSYSPAGGIDGRELIFGRKRVEGFWLTDWIRRAGFLKVLRASVQIQGAVERGAFGIAGHRTLAMEDVPEGIREYVARMTAGKILIAPQRRQAPSTATPTHDSALSSS